MRWLSIFRSNNRRWTPVTNADRDTTDMDDLMRMAMEDNFEEEEYNDPTVSDFHHSNIGPAEALFDRSYSNSLPAGHLEGPVFYHDVTTSMASDRTLAASDVHAPHRPSDVTSSSSSSMSSSSFTTSLAEHGDNFSNLEDQTKNLRSVKRHLCSSVVFPERRLCFVILSVIVPLLCMGICTGLGVYSLFVYKTDKLVIDKSVKSFSIPNHKVYKQFEAMMLARRDNSSSGRYKRDINPSTRHSIEYVKTNSRSKRAVFNDEKESESLRHTERALQKTNIVNRDFIIQNPAEDSSQRSISTLSKNNGLFHNLVRRIKRHAHEASCMFRYQSIARWKMHVIYLAQGDDDPNMFTKERLETVHQIENRIMRHPGFHEFCLRDRNIERYDPAVRSINGCIPLNSLMTYFYPSKDSQGHIFYDGMGANLDDIDSALTLAMNHETFYYYVDDKINKTNKRSYLIRSEVLFGAPLPGMFYTACQT